MRTVILLALACCAGAVVAQDKQQLRPARPVEISVTVANVAGPARKYDVVVEASVRRTETVYKVWLKGEHFVSFKLADAKPLAVALEKLADKMVVGDKETVGDLVVSVRKYTDGDKFIGVQRNETFASTEAIDRDTAGELAQALLKVEGTATWLAARVKVFQE